MKCFTAEFLQFCSAIVKFAILVAGYVIVHQFQAFQRFLWNFLMFWDPKSWVVWQLVRQLNSPFGETNLQLVTKFFAEGKSINQNWTLPNIQPLQQSKLDNYYRKLKIKSWRTDWALACFFIEFSNFPFLS